MHGARSSCLAASGSTPFGGTFGRYETEGVLDVVSPNILAKNILEFSLRSFLTALDEGQFEQIHMMRRAVDLALDIGRVSRVDVSGFGANFDDIFKIVDPWKETEDQGVAATFELEVTNKRTETTPRIENQRGPTA